MKQWRVHKVGKKPYKRNTYKGEMGVVGLSPFARIPRFNLETGMPSDPMHAVDLGVSRRMYTLIFTLPRAHVYLEGRKKGEKRPRFEITKAMLNPMGLALNRLAVGTKLPDEFSRRSREIELTRMKAEEWMAIVLLLGPSIALDILLPTKLDYARLFAMHVFCYRALNLDNDHFAMLDVEGLLRYKIYFLFPPLE